MKTTAILLSITLSVCVFALLPPVVILAGEPPVDQDGRPWIKKLGTIDEDKVENAPILFRGKLYRCEWYRKKGCFHCVEHDTGRTTAEFAQGWCFADAFVTGDTVYVTGTRHGPKVQMFVSQDLERWDTYTALELPKNTIFNTSICRAGDRYVMMYESGSPPEEAGARFTARFATSPDLRHWKVTSPECNYAKDRYTAPHCLRYLDGTFYNFFLSPKAAPRRRGSPGGTAACTAKYIDRRLGLISAGRSGYPSCPPSAAAQCGGVDEG